MNRESSGQILSAVFVDYDNIYLSLKRRNEEAAKRFAKDATVWLKEIESGRLITPTNKLPAVADRRIVLNRCYGNPVPRRNQNDNSTDMNSFPFIRHHFLRAGFEIVDCPPLTAQLKNSSDIRMVMDVRDFLHHDTRFEEFVILSGDADFTPVLHRLRAHARRTVVFANDYTAAPYVAIADGEIRETDLVSLILEGKLPGSAESAPAATIPSNGEGVRQQIMTEIVQTVRGSNAPVPLEALAERALRALGHDKTVASNWAGAGSFRDLLMQSLPEGLRLTDQPPYLVFDAKRSAQAEAVTVASRPAATERASATPPPAPARPAAPLLPPAAPAATAALSAALEAGSTPARRSPASAPVRTQGEAGHAQPPRPPLPELPAPPPAVQSAPLARTAEGATALQQSIARILDACQAPPLSPTQYRTLFEVMAQEINEAGIQGVQTLANIANRGRELGHEIRREDIRFVLDIVGETDPWFQQGASANLFAGRFRNFVVARCRSRGLNLNADEIDLIDAWFTSSAAPARPASPKQSVPLQSDNRPQGQNPPLPAPPAGGGGHDRWWALGDGRQAPADPPQPSPGRQAGNPESDAASAGRDAFPSLPSGDLNAADEFPRIVRTRLRG